MDMQEMIKQEAKKELQNPLMIASMEINTLKELLQSKGIINSAEFDIWLAKVVKRTEQQLIDNVNASLM